MCPVGLDGLETPSAQEVAMDSKYRGGLRQLVRDVMTREVRTVEPTTGFKEMVGLIEEAGVGALPVVSDARHLVGIVSETDLLLKEEGPEVDDRHLFETRARRRERSKAEGRTAYRVMSSPVVSARPDMPVQQAARLMHERRVKHLPVVDGDGCLLGIVSRGDLLRVFTRDDETLRREILDDLVLKALWMDPDAVEVEVTDGVVRLSGELERRSTVAVLLRLVGSIPGVVACEDAGLRFRVDDTRGGLNVRSLA
jgi:CBS-domain-containing membrane protein